MMMMSDRSQPQTIVILIAAKNLATNRYKQSLRLSKKSDTQYNTI